MLRENNRISLLCLNCGQVNFVCIQILFLSALSKQILQLIEVTLFVKHAFLVMSVWLRAWLDVLFILRSYLGGLKG